jgi:hypothetical protein
MSELEGATVSVEKKPRKIDVARVLGLIRTWIETESGPSHVRLSIPNLQLQITIRGYKKIILERKFREVSR